MNSGKKLIIWIAAYMENANKYYGWTTSPTQILIDHFNARGVPLGDADIKYMVSNTTGPINDAVNLLEAKLVESKYFNFTDVASSFDLAAAQWAVGNLLTMDDTNLNNFTYVGSMQNLGMSFVNTPEIGLFNECAASLNMS